MDNRIRAALVGLVSAIAVAGCSASASVGQKSINQADIERQITGEFAESVGVEPADVQCAGIAEIEVSTGQQFQCTGIAPNGDEFPIDVTLTDDEGGFRASVPETSS